MSRGYKVQRRMRFMLNGDSLQEVVLNPGDVVRAVHLPGLRHGEAEPLRKSERAERKRDHSVRLLFFRAWGVVRYARGVRDLAPTTKPVTVSEDALPC